MDNNPTPEPTPSVNPEVAPEPAQAAPVASTPTSEAVSSATVTVEGKSHLVALLLSIFVGTFGVDRFYMGHIGLGVAKLLLSWLTFGIWWIIDIILIATKKVKNVTWEQ